MQNYHIQCPARLIRQAIGRAEDWLEGGMNLKADDWALYLRLGQSGLRFVVETPAEFRAFETAAVKWRERSSGERAGEVVMR